MKTPAAALLLLLAAACGPANQGAKTSPPAAQNTAVTSTASAAVIDPGAIQALERMGNYLRGIQTVEVRSKATRDEVLTDTGQKVQFGGEAVYRIRRPNAFSIEWNTDRKQRTFIYDGSTFTIYSPRMHVYAQADAPGTIAEMVDQMEDRYGIPVPLSDLFYWGSEPVTDLQLASRIGYARVNGQETDQYAYRRGDIDWQVWIARGPQPLPVKVVITTRSDPAQPQFTAELSWRLNPSFAPATFAFRPPADAHEIELTERG